MRPLGYLYSLYSCTIHIYYIIFLDICQALFLLLVLLRLLPEAVTACLILAGPVLRRDDDAFSPFVILDATALGLHEGYGRFFLSLPERPHGFPVFTSTHSSLNHFLSAAPFLLFFTATFVTPVFSAYFAALSNSTGCICRRPNFIPRFDFLCTCIICFLFLRHVTFSSFSFSLLL